MIAYYEAYDVKAVKFTFIWWLYSLDTWMYFLIRGWFAVP